MSLNLKPLRWDWASATVGDTYPACVITETEADTTLSRVRIKIKDADGVLKLTLDSNTTGITINNAAAGAWNFTIGEISATDTATLTAGFHDYDLEITAGGKVRTEFSGTWELLPQITN